MSLTNTALGYLLNTTAARIHARTAEALAPLGLSPREAGVLHHVRTLGPVSQRALGLMLRIDRTTMVAIIDGLEGRGLLRRAADPEDRRAHALTVTRAGRQASRRADLAVARIERAFVSDLDEADVRRLRQLLGQLVATSTPD